MRKTTLAPALLIAAFIAVFLSGCIIQDDHYNTNPQPQPVGYQYEFNEEFVSDTRGWAFDDQQDSAYALVTNGVYKFVDYSFNGGYHTAVVPTGANMYGDFLLQTRMKSNYAMALIFGASNNDFGYSFFIDEQGYFAVYKEGYPAQTIIDWEANSAIRSDWNDVELEQRGGYWYGYVNGTQVFRIAARSLAGTQAGFMVLAGTTGFADYLTAKW